MEELDEMWWTDMPASDTPVAASVREERVMVASAVRGYERSERAKRVAVGVGEG